MACFWCIFCHSFLHSNNCPRGTLTMMWQCDWSLFQEQHQHCNIRCTHNSSHRLLCLSVRHTDLLHSLHNVFHSLPLSLFFSISQALSTIFFFDNSNSSFHTWRQSETVQCADSYFIFSEGLYGSLYIWKHTIHTQSVHTLKCPLTVMAEGCWQQVCSWDAILSVLADVHTHTHTYTHTHTPTHTHTHTHKQNHTNSVGKLWKINK